MLKDWRDVICWKCCWSLSSFWDWFDTFSPVHSRPVSTVICSVHSGDRAPPGLVWPRKQQSKVNVVVGGIRWLLGQGDLVNITLADILTATATHTMIRIPTTAIETKIFLSMIEQWRSNQSVSLITLITKTKRGRFMLEVFYQLSNRKLKLITNVNVYNIPIVINFDINNNDINIIWLCST